MRHKRLIVILSVVAAAVAVRAALPVAIQRHVNRTLDRLQSFDGRIGDIDLHLIRGAYEIEDIDIVKTGASAPVPFFSAEKLDLSIEWRQLINGSVVGEILFKKPRLNFIGGAPAEKEQTGENEPWTAVARDLFPLKINRLEAEDGSVHYRDPHGSPKVDVYVEALHLVATNLTNSEGLSETLAASAHANGLAMGTAPVRATLRYDPYRAEPTFDFNLGIEDLDMRALNAYFRQYLGMDVESGALELYLEAQAKEGRFEGYVKPLIRNLNVMDLDEEELTLTEKVKEGLTELVGNIVENEKKNTVASRIPFSGKFEQPEVGVLVALRTLLRNGFIEALRAGFDTEINGEK